MATGSLLYLAVHAYKGSKEDDTLDWTLSCTIDTGEGEGRLLGRASMQVDDIEKVECPTW